MNSVGECFARAAENTYRQLSATWHELLTNRAGPARANHASVVRTR
jgi:hypothetical protein